MSATELLVIVAGLAIGFWVVSFFMGKRTDAAPAAHSPGPGEATPPADAEPAWHEVLEVSPTASVDEIQAQYRSLISQYHPDKVASAGAELRALAERKSQQINAAYREAMKAQGIDP